LAENKEPERSIGEIISYALGLAVRRRWWILSTALVAVLAASAYTRMLPNLYSSEATLVVVQQQVSQRYVPSDSTQSVADTVTAISRNVLSRTKLLAIIDEFGRTSKSLPWISRLEATSMPSKFPLARRPRTLPMQSRAA
jgi:hypothetical protein